MPYRLTETEVRRNIAIHLVQYRNAHAPQLTQKQVAKQLGINRYAYAKYEQCRCTMPLMMAIRVAHMLSISIYDLIISVELDSHSLVAC